MKTLDCMTVIIMGVTVLLVLSLKFVRFYIILFGKSLTFYEQLNQYSKVIPASILFPFKLGELFRMYCYGYQLGNFIEGIICILFDRFMDTIALLTIIIGVQFFYKAKISVIVIVLLMFSIGIFVIYNTFRPLYMFWNNYFICSPGSRRKLIALLFLEKCNDAYNSVEKTITGKFLILYLLSATAWVVELGGLTVVNIVNGRGRLLDCIFTYLTAALTGQHNTYMSVFTVISIIGSFCMYGLCKIYRTIKQ